MAELRVFVGITGASGAPYALRLCRELLAAGVHLAVTVTDAGREVLQRETGLACGGVRLPATLRDYLGEPGERLTWHDVRDITAPVASGSSAADAMVVCPCTMGTLSRIACGNSANLLERGADVMLKERRPLVLVPRETPLNQI
ncbi:MAG TPA: UbiX family flavin prenyltransferase, partial [Verrucomicrobiae bacterium]|nr:UbiX family flavin prenyltransferase [Verrucomicrobiae bacterium]